MENIKIYLRVPEGKKEGSVYFSFYINRQKVHFSAKVRCLKKNWDLKNSRIKAGDVDSDDKNKIIQHQYSRIIDVFVRYRLKNKNLTRDAFLRAYNRPDDFATFFEFIENNQKKINYGNELTTYYTHRTVLGKLRDYLPELHFDDIDKAFLDRYYAHLRKDLGNNENTAYKNMSIIKKYVRAAFRMGYMDENPFDDWSIKRGKASYVYLSEDELKLMLQAYNAGTFEAKYHKTLEFFLFMCFSSLHVGDALQIKLEQFTENSFTYYRKKTRNVKPEAITIPTSEILKQIISNVVGTRRQGLIFEHLPAEQTMNRYLKDIASELEIDKAITHKAGRHTFATYFLRKTKDLTALKEILGHSELRETLIYAHVMDESKQEGMKHFDDFL